MNFRILIYCDDPSHAPRRVPVENFDDKGGAGWHTTPPSRADRLRVGTGQTIVGDALPEPGWALDPEVSNSDIRSRFEMVCRRCLHPRPVVAREDRGDGLFEVLDGLRAQGVSQVPLPVLATMLQEQAARRKPSGSP